MIYNWFRKIPFEKTDERIEEWLFYKNQKLFNTYKPKVTLGKEMDIVSLQKNVISNFEKNLLSVRKSREKFYCSKNTIPVTKCPICGHHNCTFVFKVYCANYVQCRSCSHYYINAIPSDEELEAFYTKDERYHRDYVDKKTADIRVNLVALPKAKWVINCFKNAYGAKPRKILDVGAGSGHFVEACRKLGFKADGLELSRSAIDFCADHFGFNLINKDYLESPMYWRDYDVVTFWGVIEHVANPMEMLRMSVKKKINGKRMIVVSVPRWDCLGTVIQKMYNNRIIRHLDPLGHLNCFTDASIGTAFAINNIKIIGAWYFGMDIYEMFMQIGCDLKKIDILAMFREKIPVIQKIIDSGYLSDEIILAGIVE